MFIIKFEARPDLGATCEDMAALWHGYCGAWVAEMLWAVPQRWMLGVSPDGA